MKLVRYGRIGKEKPGLIDEFGKLRDLSAVVGDFAGANLSDKVLRIIYSYTDYVNRVVWKKY